MPEMYSHTQETSACTHSSIVLGILLRLDLESDISLYSRQLNICQSKSNKNNCV